MLRIVAIIAVVAIPHCALAAPAITVDLASGRTFAGTLDARTDDERLWIRSGSETIVVKRPIEWSRIVRLKIDGRVLSRAELTGERQSIMRLAADDLENEFDEVVTRRPTAISIDKPQTTSTPTAEPARATVQSLRADAYAANWDADPEIDGLVLEIMPLSADGTLLSVDGKLDVTLFGLRTTSQNPRWRPARIGHWVRRANQDDFGPSGAVFRLPFQAEHPELDGGLASIGLVNVELSIPGQRTLETSLTDVRVRPYSAFRDLTEQSEGRRFLPVERRWRTQ